MELSRDPEIDLYKYSQLTLTNEQNQYNGAKIVCSTNSARKTGHTHTQTHTHTHTHTRIKINLTSFTQIDAK